MKKPVLLILALCLLHLCSFSQAYVVSYIKSKEGRTVIQRKILILKCLGSLNKDKNDPTALAICECFADKFNKRFSDKQIKKNTHDGILNIEGLVKDDPTLSQELDSCYTSSNKTVLLQAESFQDKFVSGCMEHLRDASEKSIDSNRLRKFCLCQLQMIKEKKLTDDQLNTLSNPNSLLFFETMYKCGDPFLEQTGINRNWTSNSGSDINGPSADTVKVLSLNGMTYVKVKIGSSIQVWLMDTGASDLLINTETEETLKKENIITENNFLGMREYEMANGTIDTCRTYNINGVQIGSFTVNNVLVAVSEKANRIIVGKSLLNKFTNWALNNQQNSLILSK